MTLGQHLPALPKKIVLFIALGALLGSRLRGSDGTADAPAAAKAPVLTKRTEAAGTIKFGDSMTERGDYGGAEIAYRQVLDSPAATAGDTKSALLGLAHMHRKKGEFVKAAAIYEKYLEKYPGDDRTPDALLELGRTLRSMGAYKLAISRFYSVINSTLKLPADGFTHYEQLAKTAQFEIAQTHFEAGEFEDASKFFDRLSLLDLTPPDRAHAQFMAAYSLSLQGKGDDAVTLLTAYIEQWPAGDDLPEARYLLATNLRSLKRTQEAIAATFDLLKTEKSKQGANAKRWAYWQKRTGNQLANEFFEDGNILSAKAIYERLAELSDDPAWQLPVTYELALCYERLGSPERSLDSYKKIVASVGDDAPADLLELKRLASWRIDHLGWRESISATVSKLMDTETGHVTRGPAPKTDTPDTP
jgi:tetratricopeptide (TPR) repeat protein